jgi:excisionase family DNA binding protein
VPPTSNEQFQLRPVIPSVASPIEPVESPTTTKTITLSFDRDAYTLKETAQRLGVSYHSILRLVQRGKLRACHALPRRPLIPRKEIARLLKTAE